MPAPSITTNRVSKNSPTGSLAGDYGAFTLPIDVNYELDAWGRTRPHEVRRVSPARETPVPGSIATASSWVGARLRLKPRNRWQAG